ncbi:SHQ1-domain-containing protein [Hymenopellis radicata]|nr:SHQ1-domain-containing protein [Hymenopellis radicata]
MITPRFTCSQTDESVIISVYCPSIRASDIEVNVDETLFTLHVNPYFLRLNFSYPILDDDNASATYDPGPGLITVTLTKENRGQEFKDLDLMAKLLAPRPSKHTPLIEVLDDELSSSMDESRWTMASWKVGHIHSSKDGLLEFLGANNDWQLPQEVPEPLTSLRLENISRYGFLNRHSGYLQHISYTENEVNELGPDAETLSPSERRIRRIKHEDDKWDEEYYMADFADTENIDALIAWESPYHRMVQPFEFTEAEKLAMLNLPRVEFLASAAEKRQLYLTLVTLLFSYAYDARTTQHDPTPESAWTICSMTPSFSALDPPPYDSLDSSAVSKDLTPADIASALIPSYRRCLAFPLYRSFALAEKCRSDVSDILSQGVRIVTRGLLEMKDILDHHEVYYIYSKIWVTDFCIWVQTHVVDEDLVKLSHSVRHAQVSKDGLGWHLVQLERLVLETEERSSDSDDESDSDADSN